MQISPQKAFPIVWVSSIPGDADTHYVQAVVRNASSLAVLATVNLVDQGSNIFSKDYRTPQDPSQTGTGLYITITITVYTDSLYTTKDQNFAVLTNTYLVKTIVDATQFLGGGTTIDAEIVRQILKEELGFKRNLLEKKDKIEEIVTEPVEKIDFSPLISEFRKEMGIISQKVDAIKIPETIQPDFTYVDNSFRGSLERVLRKIKMLPSLPNYTDSVDQLMNLYELQKKLSSSGQIMLREYGDMLATLDKKTLILLRVLENIDAATKAQHDIASVKNARLRYKS